MAAPQSTSTDEKDQDNKYNPGEHAYREGMGAGYVGSGTDQLESFANDPENHDTTADVKKSEEKGDDASLTNGLYTGSGIGGGSSKKPFSFKGFARKRGALGAIIGLVFGSGLGLSVLLSPSLLIVHMKEIMVDKFNTQLSTLDVRSTKLLNLKVKESTSGICTNKISIKCKFSTMSEPQVKNFRDAGIEVLTDEPNNGPNAGKRTKPTGYSWKGEKITATDFSRLASSDKAFRSALKQGYNPKSAGFEGKGWNRIGKYFGISKAPIVITGETREENLKQLNERAKNGQATVRKPLVVGELDPNCTGESCTNITADDVAENERNVATIEESGKNGTAVRTARSLLASGLGSSLGNIAKITGPVDTYCQAYGALKVVGYAAKTIRAIQLARYAMFFFTVADEIKAGTVKPETAAFAGEILTEKSQDVSTTGELIQRGSGTDSFGYMHAANGDTSASPAKMSTASRFLAGGGFVGELSAFSATIALVLGKPANARKTCGILGNPVVQGASLVAGIAVMFVPGAGIGSKIGNAATSAAVGVGLMLLPTLLADIVAGTTTENIVGEDSGNAIASGGCKIMCDSLAGSNGNALMTKKDSLAYSELQTRTIARYNKDDSDTLSPLDATNKNTFLGNIVFQLMPYSAAATPSEAVTTIGSIIKHSFASIMPAAKALSVEQQKAALEVCKDIEYQELGIATDPFCNIIRGIPPRYLDKDPLDVIAQLEGAGAISVDGRPLGAHAQFIKDCITTESTPGETDSSSPELTQSQCVINDSNANYYLYYADGVVESGFSGETEETATPVDSETVSPAADGFSLSSKFGVRPNVANSNFHKGSDYVNGSDSSVRAVRSGTVINVADGTAIDRSNNVVSIKHEDGLISNYWHMFTNDILVKVGDVVTPGQVIGKMGSYGIGDGVHLHFELQYTDVTDPATKAFYESFGTNVDGNYRNTRLNPEAYFKSLGLPGYD